MNDTKFPDSKTLTDARGVEVVMPRRPQRIVSLICSITETIFDFGAGGRLAGRTNYCIRPAESVDAVPKIGGPKNPDIQHILDRDPDLVIANIEENEKRDVDVLEAAGVPVYVTYTRTVDQSVELLRIIAAILDTPDAAEPYIRKAESVLESVRGKVSRLTARPRVVYLIWRKPYMTINRDTYIHDLIDYCGGENVFGGLPSRYPSVTEDDIINADPDVIVLPSEPFNFLERHRREICRIETIAAVRNNRVYRADGEMFSWFGARMIFGLPYAYELFHGHESG